MSEDPAVAGSINPINELNETTLDRLAPVPAVATPPELASGPLVALGPPPVAAAEPVPEPADATVPAPVVEIAETPAPEPDAVAAPARAARSLPEPEVPVAVLAQPETTPRAARRLVDTDDGAAELAGDATIELAAVGDRPGRWAARVFEALLAAAVVAAGGALANRVPTQAPQPAAQKVVSAVSLVCPGVGTADGAVYASVGTDATWAPLGRAATPVQGVFERSTSGASLLAGHGSVAGIALFLPPAATASAQLASAACAAPSATGYLQVATADARVALTNPDAEDAVLNVSILGPDGVIASPDLVDLKVAPATTVEIPLGKYALAAAPLTVRWQATVGRVAGWAVVDGKSLDIAAPTRPDTSLVVPGVYGGSKVQVIVANYATTRAKLKIDALTADGKVPVAGAEDITVEASTSMIVDVTAALQGQTVSLVVTSDQPLVASGWVSAGSDTATSPALPLSQIQAQDRLGVAGARSVLVLSNAGAAKAQATITMTPVGGRSGSQTVILAPGTTVTVVVPDASAVRVQAPAGVAAALTAPPGDGSPGVDIVALPPDLTWSGTTPVWAEAQPT